MDAIPPNTNSGATGNDFVMVGQNVAGRDIYLNYQDDDDNAVKCPYCGKEPDSIPENGEINCTGCKESYYEWRPTPNTVSHYKNVPTEHSHKYGDLMFQITAHIELEDFKKAEEKCIEAIDVSSRTPQGWEYRAYCYYLNTRKEDIIKSRGKKLIKFIKIAEEADSNSITLEKIRQTIAHKLYHVLRHRIIFFRRKTDIDKLKKQELISYYIMSWETCYKIYPSPFFLKQILNYFYGHSKENWYDYEYSVNDDKFQLLHIIHELESPRNTFNNLISKIIKKDPSYSIPIIKGGNFNGLTKLPLDQLLEKRKEEKEKQHREHIKSIIYKYFWWIVGLLVVLMVIFLS